MNTVTDLIDLGLAATVSVGLLLAAAAIAYVVWIVRQELDRRER